MTDIIDSRGRVNTDIDPADDPTGSAGAVRRSRKCSSPVRYGGVQLKDCR